jgi:hypothetical protein
MMYLNAKATPYDETKILDRRSFFFEQAKPELFDVNDCFVHAFNGAARCALFIDRKQVFEMVQRRSHKNSDFLAEQKMREGYAPVNFDHFLVKGSCSYAIMFLKKVTKKILGDGKTEQPLYDVLRIFVES